VYNVYSIVNVIVETEDDELKIISVRACVFRTLFIPFPPKNRNSLSLPAIALFTIKLR